MTKSSGGSTRTTFTDYDDADRVTKTWTDVTGLTGSEPVRGTETVHDPRDDEVTEVGR